MAEPGQPRRSRRTRIVDALVWGALAGAASGAVLGAAIDGVGAAPGALVGAVLMAGIEASIRIGLAPGRQPPAVGADPRQPAAHGARRRGARARRRRLQAAADGDPQRRDHQPARPAPAQARARAGDRRRGRARRAIAGPQCGVGARRGGSNFTATLLPRNAGEHDLELTSRSELPFPGHYLSSVDGERDALTVLKLLAFEERIEVWVTGDGELHSDHSFALAGRRFLTLHYEIARL